MTLYVSDHVWTLLPPGAALSDYTRRTLTELLKRGVNFTVATARTPATVTSILRGLDISLPCIMMNGAVSFSMTKGRFSDTALFGSDTARRVTELADMCPVTTFLYSCRNNALQVFYRDDRADTTREFINARSGSVYKTFTEVIDYTQSVCDGLMYCAALGPESVLARFAAEYKKLTSLDTVMYREVNSRDIYVLESYASGVSKAKAVKKLALKLGADKIVAFGDNINDIEMLSQADLGLAVSNAAEEVLACANGVIGSNPDDGVAKWLLENAV